MPSSPSGWEITDLLLSPDDTLTPAEVFVLGGGPSTFHDYCGGIHSSQIHPPAVVFQKCASEHMAKYRSSWIVIRLVPKLLRKDLPVKRPWNESSDETVGISASRVGQASETDSECLPKRQMDDRKKTETAAPWFQLLGLPSHKRRRAATDREQETSGALDGQVPAIRCSECLQ